MDGLTLLVEARAAGLTVNAIDGRLVIRGPRQSEAIALRLIEAKVAVMVALAGDAGETGTIEAQAPTQRIALSDLSKILPPVEWLTPKQRRLWRERTPVYQSEGMEQTEAETEAMSELVMTGALLDASRQFPWPR